MTLLHLMGWELWYFNYWLTHMFYFTAGLIILFAISYNKWEYYKNKIIFLKRLEKNTDYTLPREGILWHLTQ